MGSVELHRYSLLTLRTLHIEERLSVTSITAPDVGMMFKHALMHREPLYIAGKNIKYYRHYRN